MGLLRICGGVYWKYWKCLKEVMVFGECGRFSRERMDRGKNGGRYIVCEWNGVEVYVRYFFEGFSEIWEFFVESCGFENERNG